MKSEAFKFWMVWREGSSSPVYRHTTKAAAVKEAERLAKLNPDQIFYVFKTIAAVRANSSISRIKLIADDIPF
ncbi:DUF2188 domain-containing protein [Ochrobactrum sp. MR28]|nr:DUF2188 domain-containing protein [Ochrobactrum sp. MR28]MBX8816231.1 DUF2188 domain-containing protein [Ochrobactrum sp. MR31]